MDEVYFIGKHQADFIDNPDVSLSQPPHTRSQDSHRNTHIATNAASLGAARSLPPLLSPSNTNTKTPTQLNTQFEHLRQPWVSSQQDRAGA